MLNHEKLVDLYRELQSEPVLSIYIDADQRDPAERSKWRKALEAEIGRCRKRLEDRSAGEREQFEEALTRLQEELQSYDAFLPGKGWVGFATADEMWYAESVPVPMPDLVRWEPGIRVAPYVRGLKQARPVIVVLADNQRARIFEYRDGDVEETEDLRADTFVGDLSDVGVRKQSAHASGIRGETSTDQAQRILEVSSDRMTKELVRNLSGRMGPHGFLVVGGTQEVSKHLADAMPKSVQDRVLQQPSLHVDMKNPEVKEAVEQAASEMTNRYQEELVGAVIDSAKAHGRGCLGREETERALQEMRVDTLLLSRTFISEDPDFADLCVGAAFSQNAAVEELSAVGAERLDDEGGIGARLRFKIRQNGKHEQESAA